MVMMRDILVVMNILEKEMKNSDFVYSQIPEMSQVQWDKQGSTSSH